MLQNLMRKRHNLSFLARAHSWREFTIYVDNSVHKPLETGTGPCPHTAHLRLVKKTSKSRKYFLYQTDTIASARGSRLLRQPRAVRTRRVCHVATCVWRFAGGLPDPSALGRAAAPLLPVGLLRCSLNFRVSPAQQQGARRTDARAQQAKIGGRIEQARVPALPARQHLLNLLAQIHEYSDSQTRRYRSPSVRNLYDRIRCRNEHDAVV
jgi:hypothetical protein